MEDTSNDSLLANLAAAGFSLGQIRVALEILATKQGLQPTSSDLAPDVESIVVW
jgi:hypothetical protein